MRLGLVVRMAKSAFCPGKAAWQYAMYFNWNRVNRKANFNANDIGNSNQKYAAPVVQGLFVTRWAHKAPALHLGQ